jgi:curved DNA-binding protein CbpA
MSIATHEVDYFEDYYEILEITPGVDVETIGRAYKSLVQRYHPDNQQSGDVEKFMLIVKAHEILSNPETRSAYDHDYRRERKPNAGLIPITEEDGYVRDKRMFERVLSLLYHSRRSEPRHGGMGIVQIEQKLGSSSSHLEFHLWYLREKGWVDRLENGLMAITAEGVDRVMDRQDSSDSRARGGRKWFSRPWRSWPNESPDA